MKALLAGCCLMLAAHARADDVTVVVSGIRNARGSIAVAICDKSSFPGGTCPYRARSAARPNEVTVRFSNVPPGTWAVAAYHDEDNAGRLEFTLFGTPKQGFGFSRDAKMRFGPPRFTDAAFSLGTAGSAVTVPLHYP
jgi:uncharacterized protein (DUF2141 family)